MSLSHLTRGQLRTGLLACHDVLTTTLRASDPLGEFVDGLAGAYGGAFDGQMGALRAALESAGGPGVLTAGDVREMVRAAGQTFGASWQPPDAQPFVGGAYGLGRSGILLPLGDEVDWDDGDAEAVDGLADELSFWGGQAWNVLGDYLEQALMVGLVEPGRSAGDGLNDALDAFAGRAATYWPVLAAVSLTRSRSFGTIGSCEQIGARSARYTALIDDHTSPVCLIMHGRIFPVSALADARDQWLEMSPRKAVREQPFPEPDELDGMSTEDLVERGWTAPPLHFGPCRAHLWPMDVPDEE